jgi:hypothetical protein
LDEWLKERRVVSESIKQQLHSASMCMK